MKKVALLSLVLISSLCSAQNKAEAGTVKLKSLSGEGFNYTLNLINNKEASDFTKSFFSEYGAKFSSERNGEFTLSNMKILAISPNEVKAVGLCNEVDESTYNCGIIFLEGIKNITPGNPGFEAAQNIMDVFVTEANKEALEARIDESDKALSSVQKDFDKTDKDLSKLEQKQKDLEKELEEVKKELAETKQAKADLSERLNTSKATNKSLKEKRQKQ